MKYLKIISLLSIISIQACNQNDPEAPLVIPDDYNGTSFVENTTTEAAVTTQLVNLINEAKKGRTPGTAVELTALQSLYLAGNPNLKTISTAYFASKVEGTSGYLAELAKSSGGTFVPGETTGEGGTLGAYLFDERGVEMEQLIEKGQFGSVLYHHAVNVLNGTRSPEMVDRAMAAMGLNPTFPNTSSASKTPQPDRFMAVYAARRDKNDGNGLYSQLKLNHIKLQAALNAGSDYTREADEAITDIKLLWEKVNAATIINYCHSATSTLSNTELTDAQIGNALHAIGEAIGFCHGWKTLAANDKVITDAQIDQILILLNAPATGEANVYRFATDAVNELPKLQQVIGTLKGLYQFSDQDIEDFRRNWINDQQR